MRENGYPLHPGRGVARRATVFHSAAAPVGASWALRQNARAYGAIIHRALIVVLDRTLPRAARQAASYRADHAPGYRTPDVRPDAAPGPGVLGEDSPAHHDQEARVA